MSSVILIAEDEASIEDAIEIYLKSQGYQTLKAANGAIAWEQLQNNTVDLAIIDVMMPVMGVNEDSRRIRRLERADAESVPIIAITANAFQEDIIESEEAGMNAHLSKPLDFVALGRQIELLTRHKRKLQREKGKRT